MNLPHLCKESGGLKYVIHTFLNLTPELTKKIFLYFVRREKRPVVMLKELNTISHTLSTDIFPPLQPATKTQIE